MGHFQTLKSMKEANRRLEWGVMARPASIRAVGSEEVRPGEGASLVPRGREYGPAGLGRGLSSLLSLPLYWESQRRPLRVSGRPVTGSALGHYETTSQQADSLSVSVPTRWVTCPPHSYPQPPLAKKGLDQCHLKPPAHRVHAYRAEEHICYPAAAQILRKYQNHKTKVA